MYRLGRRPALDGIRALAVAAVVLFHANEHTRGGYYGVYVFFVLSGFLITTLLLQENRDTGGIDRRAFYMRRARRLVPALAATLLLVVLVYAASPKFQGKPVGDLLAVVFYSGNWLEATGTHLANGLLTPAWSLAIEEQFYILWPLALLAGLHRRWPTRNLLVMALVPALGSAVARIALTPTHNLFAGFSTFTNADSILLGCALAVAVNDDRLRAKLSVLRRTPVAVVAGGILAVAVTTNPAPHTPVYFAVVLASVALIGHVALVDTSRVTRLLAARPLTWTGRRSYGIYLYHVPIMFGVFSGVTMATQPKFALELAAIVLVAAVSFRYVEQPFMRKRQTRVEGVPVPTV